MKRIFSLLFVLLLSVSPALSSAPAPEPEPEPAPQGQAMPDLSVVNPELAAMLGLLG